MARSARSILSNVGVGLSFEGPERLCEWCAELANDCDCGKQPALRQQFGRFVQLRAFTMPPVKANRQAPFVLTEPLPPADWTPYDHYAKSKAILAVRFWCPYCKREMPIHACMNVR